MNRLLITGGSSYLGRNLLPLATEEWDVVHTYFSAEPSPSAPALQLDLRDGPAVQSLVDHVRPEVILHLAGSNQPADTMDAVIRQGTAHIVAAAGRVRARLIHLSTDVVYDGQHAPYREEDPPAPLHAYGWAKAAAEQMVMAHADHVIVRTSLIYGLTIMDRGTAWIAAALRDGRPVTLFTDQMRNPVWVESLSRACLELAANEYRGVLHVAGAQRMSRAEFGLRMLDWWQVAERASMQLGSSDPARWPQDTTLDISCARALLRTSLPGVDAVLAAAETA
jgi:dTDP-4-dehydrorhamnose reductase